VRAGSGDDSNEANRTLLLFDLGPLPSGCSVKSAVVRLYYFGDGYSWSSSVSPTLEIRRISASWDKTEVTWNNRSHNQPWAQKGGDYSPIVVSSTKIQGGSYGWVSWDATILVSAWVQNTTPNQGLIVMEPGDDKKNAGRKLFRSWNYAYATHRPYLEVFCGP